MAVRCIRLRRDVVECGAGDGAVANRESTVLQHDTEHAN